MPRGVGATSCQGTAGGKLILSDKCAIAGCLGAVLWCAFGWMTSSREAKYTCEDAGCSGVRERGRDCKERQVLKWGPRVARRISGRRYRPARRRRGKRWRKVHPNPLKSARQDGRRRRRRDRRATTRHGFGHTSKHRQSCTCREQCSGGNDRSRERPVSHEEVRPQRHGSGQCTTRIKGAGSGTQVRRGWCSLIVGAVSLWLTGTATQADAANPGHGRDPDDLWNKVAESEWRTMLRQTHQKTKAAIRQCGPPITKDVRPLAFSHPQSGKTGLQRVLAPGIKGKSARNALQDAKQGEFALKVETVNGTGMRAIKERLMNTGAHIVCAQETWVVESEIAKWSAWARRQGWKSTWEAATRKEGASRGASGGVAIFAREELGVRHPSRHGPSWFKGRTVAAVVEAPGMRPLLVISVYGKHGG